MTSQLRSQNLSSYLTSTRFANLNWCGTQQTFLLNWKEQARVYNEVSVERYTDSQLIQFLNACVSGTPNLSGVLNLHNTASKAAGITTVYAFEDYT